MLLLDFMCPDNILLSIKNILFFNIRKQLCPIILVYARLFFPKIKKTDFLLDWLYDCGHNSVTIFRLQVIANF